MNDTFLTTGQVAEMLQVHPLTVLKYIKERRLKAIKLGRVYRVKKEDVFEFMEQQASGEKPKESLPEAKKEDNSHDNQSEIEYEDERRGEITEIQEEIPIEEELGGTEDVQHKGDSAAKDVDEDKDHYII